MNILQRGGEVPSSQGGEATGKGGETVYTRGGEVAGRGGGEKIGGEPV